MSWNKEPILIVGGGLGGLATALALGRKGLPVRVLEQAPEFGVIGYGIQLGPNVFPMFDRLGVSDAVRRRRIFRPLRSGSTPTAAVKSRASHRRGYRAAVQAALYQSSIASICITCCSMPAAPPRELNSRRPRPSPASRITATASRSRPPTAAASRARR